MITTPFWSALSWYLSFRSGVIGASFMPSPAISVGFGAASAGLPASRQASCLSSGFSASVAFNVTSLPSRHSTTGTWLPDLGLGDDARQGVHVLHVLAVELQDDVAVVDLRLVGRAAVVHAGHHRAGRVLQPQALGDVRRHLLDAHAQPAAPRMAEIASTASTTFFAMLDGIEKPMPIDPPDGE